MDGMSLLISLISGVVGGNIAGAASPEDKNLGPIGNSIAGLVGGGAGGYILQALGLFATAAATAANSSGDQGLNITQLLGNIGGSGVGGAILTFVVAWIKDAMQKK